MSAQARRFTVYPGGQDGRSETPPGREYQELWFRIARLPWASVVLVPAASGTSAGEVATALAGVGSSLRDTPVTAVVVDTVDYGAARALAEMQPRLTNGGAWQEPLHVEAKVVDRPPEGAETARVATPFPPNGRAIIAIQPVVDEPLGVAIAQAADAVVLCVEMGKSRMGATRRTMELIGEERIIGALLIR